MGRRQVALKLHFARLEFDQIPLRSIARAHASVNQALSVIGQVQILLRYAYIFTGQHRRIERLAQLEELRAYGIEHLGLGSLYLQLGSFRTQRAFVAALEHLVNTRRVEPVGRRIAIGKHMPARRPQVKCLGPERQRRVRTHSSDEALRTRIVDAIARGHDGQVMLQQKLLGSLQGQLPGHIDLGRRYGQPGGRRRGTLPPCL